MLKTHEIQTSKREEIRDITSLVENVVRESGISSGLAHVFVPHTTCGVTINENADPDVKRDILYWMGKYIRQDENFHHGEGNSDAHIKTLMSGQSVSVIVENSRLLLGTWQGIYFCEFDGPRKRSFFVKVLS